jgi:hypothetical protein
LGLGLVARRMLFVRDSLTDRQQILSHLWVLVRDLRVEKMSARARERAVNGHSSWEAVVVIIVVVVMGP